MLLGDEVPDRIRRRPPPATPSHLGSRSHHRGRGDLRVRSYAAARTPSDHCVRCARHRALYGWRPALAQLHPRHYPPVHPRDSRLVGAQPPSLLAVGSSDLGRSQLAPRRGEPRVRRCSRRAQLSGRARNHGDRLRPRRPVRSRLPRRDRRPARLLAQRGALVRPPRTHHRPGVWPLRRRLRRHARAVAVLLPARLQFLLVGRRRVPALLARVVHVDGARRAGADRLLDGGGILARSGLHGCPLLPLVRGRRG